MQLVFHLMSVLSVYVLLAIKDHFAILKQIHAYQTLVSTTALAEKFSVIISVSVKLDTKAKIVR